MRTTMNVEEFHLRLPSKNLKESLQFYTDALLFTKVFDFAEYCTVSLDRFWLSFIPADGACMPVRRNNGGHLCTLQLADIHNYYQRVRQVGRASFEQELELMMPGVWQFSVIDNNGYFIGFSMPNRSI